jgi:hypothetical protein
MSDPTEGRKVRYRFKCLAAEAPSFTAQKVDLAGTVAGALRLNDPVSRHLYGRL